MINHWNLCNRIFILSVTVFLSTYIIEDIDNFHFWKIGILFLNFLHASQCPSLIENILPTRNRDMDPSEPGMWVLSNVVDICGFCLPSLI